MEYYVHATMKNIASTKRLYTLNHYTIGVILFGETQKVIRQSLKNVRILVS